MKPNLKPEAQLVSKTPENQKIELEFSEIVLTTHSSEESGPSGNRVLELAQLEAELLANLQTAWTRYIAGAIRPATTTVSVSLSAATEKHSLQEVIWSARTKLLLTLRLALELAQLMQYNVLYVVW